MTFKKILIPYDGSKLSDHAFKFGLEIAKHTNSQVFALDCINTYFKADMFPGADFDFENLVLNKLRKKAKNDMKKLEGLAKKKEVRIKTFVINSPSIANSIISFANSNKIDLIVMAPHSRSKISEFFLGSISNSVVHQSTIPVLIVK